jgi:hypothetical protein
MFAWTLPLLILNALSSCTFNNNQGGCQRDNTSHACLLKGLILQEYSHKSPQKNLLKYQFKKYYYVKVYVKDFKKHVIIKVLKLIYKSFLCLKTNITVFNEWFWISFIHWIYFKLIYMFQWYIKNLTMYISLVFSTSN